MLTINNPSSKEIRIPYYGTSKKILAGMISTLVFIPVLTFAALVPCGNSDSAGKIAIPCNFDYFIQMINGIINWFISIAGVIFTISAIYGGFLYMTSGENPGNKTKAKSILWRTLIGFVIILMSWVIVYTIVHYLADPNQESLILKFLK